MPWPETEIQRFLTINFITKKNLNAPAIWLKPEAASSAPDDAFKHNLNTDLEEWRSHNDDRNLGVRLTDGYIELRIQAPDDGWIRCLFDACASLNVDARAAFGTKGKPISSIILQVDSPRTIERWRDRWPRGHKDKAGQWVETAFAYSEPPTKTAQTTWVESRPLPGSRFGGNLVVWRPLGKPQAADKDIGIEDLEPRQIAPTSMEAICRAIAFATLAYWVRIYLDGLTEWDASLIRVIGGWTARLIREGLDINARGKSLEGICWSPVDSNDTALSLMRFLGAGRELEVAFAHADAALERNATAPVPGWSAIETLFGPQAKIGIRRAFRAGLDIDVIERMSDQYAYDRMAHDYLDRDALLKGLTYQHKHDDLIRDYQNDPVFDNRGRPHNPFQLYAASSLRTDVEHREFRPGHEPAAILRYSPVHGLLSGEDRQPDEYRLLNIFPGFTIKPIAEIDPVIMKSAITMLDRMLGLLTQDNDAQILWLKKFEAHLIQFPHIKPQSCPIIIGGQGIGKSVYGQDLQTALLGSMAGTAEASTLSENKFLIAPFVGKLIVFIDEVKLESVGAINTIKKLVRSQYVSGQFKFQHQRDYYIPGRVMIASNSPDIGLTPADAADRAFFFIMSWTAENKRMTDREFQDWTITLKPFYSEFITALESVAFKRHLMRYFMDLEVTRAELEDLTHSSRNDENVVKATMSKAREVARNIVADARVLAGMDITSWFTSAMLREAIKRVDGARSKVEAADVMMEFRRAGVLDTARGDLHYFKYRYGTLLEKMGAAHNLPITNFWDYEPDDWGDNDVRSTEGGKTWRGNKQRTKQQQNAKPPPPEPDYDPDEMQPF